jgi:predicted DNA-binding protein (UPF0251 family)
MEGKAEERRVGRPVQPEECLRKEQVHIYLTRTEAEALRMVVLKQGTTISNMVRDLIFSKELNHG